MFERIALPYPYEGLEPVIDRETVKTHYEKHHKTYTDKFNDLLEKAPALKGKSAPEILASLDQAPAEIRTGLRNNGGGYYNHNLYFESLIPGGKKPSPVLQKCIDKHFGSLDSLWETMIKAATIDLFGSGYAWLIKDGDSLKVVTSANQDNPAMQNPSICLLLPLDMWEHAYYLKYRNEKKEYATKFANIINWEKVEERIK